MFYHTVRRTGLNNMTEFELKPDLVFDIGLHHGDDAAYYLNLGYRVVGVEANPVLAAGCARRFQNEIREGRLAIINAGVLEKSGTFIFYRSLRDDGWSSFKPERQNRGGQWEEMSIPCVTTLQLISEHGIPFFMKIDIEGADFQVLKSLTPAIAPAYVSLELNCDDPFVERLIELGYSAFKFVDGMTHWPSFPIFDHEIGWRFLRKLGRLVPSVRSAIAWLPQRYRPKSEWNPPGQHNPDGYPFTSYSSGPFGEMAAGSWMAPPAAVRRFRVLKANYRRAGTEDSMWYDVNARHSSVRM